MAPRLCNSVEGVEFWVVTPRSRALRCVITGVALQVHYGADAESPDGWLRAFQAHRQDIEGRALGAAGRRDDVHVVLVTDGSGTLRTVAGRCGS